MNGMIDASTLEKIVKAYDIRGRVPDEFDATIAKRVGRAAALELGHSKFIVGRDQRASSPSIALGFIDGVLSQGVDVIDVGCVPTEVVAFASGKMNLPSAMVTASLDYSCRWAVSRILDRFSGFLMLRLRWGVGGRRELARGVR